MEKEIPKSHCFDLMQRLTRGQSVDEIEKVIEKSLNDDVLFEIPQLAKAIHKAQSFGDIEKLNYEADGLYMEVKFMGSSYGITIKEIRGGGDAR